MDDANFVIELKLLTDKNQLSVLEKRFSIAEGIYNKVLKHGNKQLKRMRERKEYKSALNKLMKAKEAGNKKDEKIYNKILKDMRKRYKLSEYAFHSFVQVQQRMYKNI